jgi:hypothetical protein
MPRLLARVFDRLPSGYWAGLVLGLAAFAVSAFVLSVVYWALRPFVWAAIYGVPYVSPPGPFSPLSGEWLFVQLIWLASAVVLGRVVHAFSGIRGRWVLLSLALPWLLLSVLALPSHEATGWRLGLTFLQVPIGVVVGYALWPRRAPQVAAADHL